MFIYIFKQVPCQPKLHTISHTIKTKHDKTEKELSNELKKLLWSILNKNGELRPSIFDISHHPWMSQPFDPLEAREHIIDSLRKTKYDLSIFDKELLIRKAKPKPDHSK